MNPLTQLVWLVMLTPPDCRLEDADRFPPPDFCRAQMKFYCEVRADLSARIAWHECRPEYVEYYRALYERAGWHWQVWDSLNAAVSGEGPDPAHRMKWLRRFRELVGEEVYWSGNLNFKTPLDP
mgnify:CR=1 FL=1